MNKIQTKWIGGGEWQLRRYFAVTLGVIIWMCKDIACYNVLEWDDGVEGGGKV